MQRRLGAVGEPPAGLGERTERFDGVKGGKRKIVHIKRQLTFLWIAFAAMVVLIAVLIAAVAVGLSTLKEASYWSGHTNEVLEAIYNVSRAYEEADQEGRTAITGEGDPRSLLAKRAVTNSMLTALKGKVTDNDTQKKNVAAFEKAITARFAAQDKQITTVQRIDGRLIFDASVTSDSIIAAKNVENAQLRVRDEEIQLLNTRTDLRTLTQYRIATLALAVIFCLLLSAIVLFVVARKGMVRRIDIAQSMRAAPTGIPPEQVEHWVRQLEEATEMNKIITYVL